MAAPNRYINRELSWLEFNRRVLAEGARPTVPLLERIKYLSIFESNLDEFYMVRVSGLVEQAEAGINELSPDGLDAEQQLALIAQAVPVQRAAAAALFESKLVPALRKAGIRLCSWEEVSAKGKAALTDQFDTEIFGVCTPLLLEPNVTFPFISNRALNLAVDLDDDGERKLGRVKVPTVIPRCIPVPGEKGAFILVEDLIAAHLDRLFPGVRIIGSHLFRVIRDADIEIRELEASDLITAIEQTLRLRRMGAPVLLECQSSLPERWRTCLRTGLELNEEDVLLVDGRLGYDFLWTIASLDFPRLKHPPHTPYLSPALASSEELFDTVKKGDVLVHHPYDSFASIEHLVGSAADDPNVLGIKQTLYRVGSKSPVVESLLAAAEAGKQVAVMVELKARFDETNNLAWARALERAGVHVSYGFPNMKTHCKLCLVVRREPEGIRTYVHVGTGNYNPATARLYTDIGLLTCDPDICLDANQLFNYLTGLSKQTSYRKLVVAPMNVRETIIEKIDREAAHAREGRPGLILFKLNSLVDPEVIDSLYEASKAGVVIKLLVRGICCLRPGVRGLSRTIDVVSVVGRFLEHSRVYYFGNAGSPEALIGSADMMRRNLDRRIEVLAPVSDPRQLEYLRHAAVETGFADNQQAWRLTPSGAYRRVRPGLGDKPRSAQEELLSQPAGRLAEGGD